MMINCEVTKSKIVKREMISVERPGQSLQPNCIDVLVGKVVYRNFKAGKLFSESDISPYIMKKSRYKLLRPYGISPSYHDYQPLTDGVELDFVEFHLSYQDLEVNLAIAFKTSQPLGYALHSPDLFAGDHIMGLANCDENYRRYSITVLKRENGITGEMRSYFPQTRVPLHVINAGGWTPQGFLPRERRQQLYDMVADARLQVDMSPVGQAIQTMPPFPLHFGGQSLHNLFVDPHEIDRFCSRQDTKFVGCFTLQ